MSISSDPQPMTAYAQFTALLHTHLKQGDLVRLVLSRHVGTIPELQRIIIKPIVIKRVAHLSFVSQYKTRDITQNHPIAAAQALIATLLPQAFHNALLCTTTSEIQLTVKGGQARLHTTHQGADAPSIALSTSHDREKHRVVDITRPFLHGLGVTDGQQQLIPAMSRKWKQINKFVEIFDGAFNSYRQRQAQADKQVSVVDFGSGKGYLTFAIHDFLHRAGFIPQVTGVELRSELVTLCQNVAQSNQMTGLDFFQGDVRTYQPKSLDVMIALHACDVATDYALHTGIRLGASIIMSAPCCHKQLRPQLSSPDVLRPLLQHGVHLGQEAEMLTDGLRALLLEACGYETKIFEFVALEHTSKNKMILATKRSSHDAAKQAQVLAQIAALKTFYGIGEHCLENLLLADGLLG